MGPSFATHEMGRLTKMQKKLQTHQRTMFALSQNGSVTDVAETATVDHGSHNVDIPVKGHFEEAGQPRGGRLGMKSTATKPRARERGDIKRWKRC